MILRPMAVKGRNNWAVVTSKRIVNKPLEQTILYLGRLDGLSHTQVRDKLNKVRALGDTLLTHEFETLLIRLGYQTPPPSLSEYGLRTDRSYGLEYVLVCIAQRFSVVARIDEQGAMRGGPPLAG